MFFTRRAGLGGKFGFVNEWVGKKKKTGASNKMKGGRGRGRLRRRGD